MSNSTAPTDCALLRTLWPTFQTTRVLNGTNCCTTAGVTCSGGQITEIFIPSTNAAGTIPSGLSGLKALKYLELSNNKLRSKIPVELASLPIVDLYLDGNQLEGSIPPELGRLRLRGIMLFGNPALQGPVPKEWSNLTINAGCTSDGIERTASGQYYCCNLGNLCSSPFYNRPAHCGEAITCGSNGTSIANSESKPLETGAIAGIVVGSVVLVALLAFGAFLLFKKKQKKDEKKPAIVQVNPNETVVPLPMNGQQMNAQMQQANGQMQQPPMNAQLEMVNGQMMTGQQMNGQMEQVNGQQMGGQGVQPMSPLANDPNLPMRQSTQYYSTAGPQYVSGQGVSPGGQIMELYSPARQPSERGSVVGQQSQIYQNGQAPGIPIYQQMNPQLYNQTQMYGPMNPQVYGQINGQTVYAQPMMMQAMPSNGTDISRTQSVVYVPVIANPQDRNSFLIQSSLNRDVNRISDRQSLVSQQSSELLRYTTNQPSVSYQDLQRPNTSYYPTGPNFPDATDFVAGEGEMLHRDDVKFENQ